MKKNAKIQAYYSYPVNGLPLQNNLIPLSECDTIEFTRVPNDSDFATLVKLVNKAHKKSLASVKKEHNKKAIESHNAKALWMQTI
jgi:hypothetical protein